MFDILTGPVLLSPRAYGTPRGLTPLENGSWESADALLCRPFMVVGIIAKCLEPYRVLTLSCTKEPIL